MDALFSTPLGWVAAGSLVVVLIYGVAVWIDRRRRPAAAPLRDDHVEALLALVTGDRRRAEQLLGQVAERQPDDALAFLLFGALLTQRGEGVRAARLIEGLLARGDLDPTLESYARERLIEAQVRAGRTQDAAASARRLRTAPGAELERIARRAALAMAARAFDVADSLGARVEREDRERGAQLLALSLAAQAEDAADAGHSDEALKLARRATAKDKGAAAAWALEGELLLQVGKLDKARAAFLEALKLEPRLGLAVFPPLEDAHMELGKVADYEGMLETLLEARPRDPIALWALGRHWVRRRHLPEGVRALSEAVELAPAFWRARRALARARAEQAGSPLPDDPRPTPSATVCRACGSAGVRGIVRCPVCGHVGTIVFTFAAPAEPGSLPAAAALTGAP